MKVSEYNEMMTYMLRPKKETQVASLMDEYLGDQKEYQNAVDEGFQGTFEEYLRIKFLERKELAIGGRIGFSNGPPGKLVIEEPKTLTGISGDRKLTADQIAELDPDYKGQLLDKRRVKTSTLDDAIEIRNIIIKNKGHVSNLEELGRLAGIVTEGTSAKVDQRKTQLALDLALDSFEELKGFKLADAKYPKINTKKFRYLDMVAKSFANHNNATDALEAAAHLLQDNMGMIYDLGDKVYLEDPKDPKKAKKVLEKGFFNLRGKITPADKKFISERVASLTGKEFSIDNVNKLIEKTTKVRRSEGSIKRQLKRNAKMNEQIKNLADDNIIQNLLKGDLNRKTQEALLERATKLVGGDVSIASRRLFQMAEAMSDTTDQYKNLGIELNNNKANKIIATGRQIGGVNNRYGMSSVLYNYYGNVVDKALGTTEGKTFIGNYQQKIKNLLDKGQSPDEIFSLTASARRGMSPYAIFTQNLRTDVNSAIKGAYIDSALSTKHEQLQEIFQGRTYNQLNAKEKAAANELVKKFEEIKINALNQPINPGAVERGAKPIYLTADEKKNIQLPEFDLKNPPSKSIANYASYDKNLRNAFDTSYKNVGYSMKVPKEFKTQKELINFFENAPIPNRAKAFLFPFVAGATAITSMDLMTGSVQAAEPGQIDEEGFTTTEKLLAGTTAGAAYAARKPILKTLSAIARPLGFPSVAAGLSLSNILDYEKPEDASILDRLNPMNYEIQDDPNLKMAGVDLLLPEIIKSAAPRGSGILSTLGRVAANPFGRAARLFTPVGAGITAIGLGKDYYDFVQSELARKAADPEAYAVEQEEQMGISA